MARHFRQVNHSPIIWGGADLVILLAIALGAQQGAQNAHLGVSHSSQSRAGLFCGAKNIPRARLDFTGRTYLAPMERVDAAGRAVVHQGRLGSARKSAVTDDFRTTLKGSWARVGRD